MTADRAMVGAAFHSAPIKTPPRCAACRFFCSDPQELESRIAGLRSFGSAFAAVRDADGLCTRHDRYLRATAYCQSFEARIADSVAGH